LYYVLAAINVIPHVKKGYGRLDKEMTDGRKNGRFEPDCIVDDRHPIADIEDAYKSPDDWVDDYIDVLRKIDKDYHSDNYYYKFPKWYGQKYYVEIWAEKQAAMKRLEEIRHNNDLQVRIIAFGGFPSFADLNNHIIRLKQKINLGKNIAILYLGDFDPSGEKIDETTRNNMMNVLAWQINQYAQYHNVEYHFKRIAVTKEQIKDYELPWDPEKQSDEVQEELLNNPNYESHLLRHGQVYACGLDAFEILKPKEYENNIVKWFDKLFDKKIYDKALKEHKEKHTQEYIKGIRLDKIEKFLKELKK
jgi:hypothetical protein